MSTKLTSETVLIMAEDDLTKRAKQVAQQLELYAIPEMARFLSSAAPSQAAACLHRLIQHHKLNKIKRTLKLNDITPLVEIAQEVRGFLHHMKLLEKAFDRVRDQLAPNSDPPTFPEVAQFLLD